MLSFGTFLQNACSFPTDTSVAANPKKKPSAVLDSEPPSSILGDDELSLHQCAGMVEVQEVSTGIGSVCEEVAVLYANGNIREAESLLEAVLRDSAHAGNEWPWTMLLDLYRLTGQRERFDSKVIDYATRFERSPPQWRDLSTNAAKGRASSSATAVNLSGNLSAGVSKQLAPYSVIGQRNGAVRIDLQTVRGADDAGCQEMLEAIAQMRRDRIKVSLANVGKLSEALGARIMVGTADQQPAWQLLLELLQHQDDQDRFEQLALDYAITFEESPPSWAPVEAVPEVVVKAEPVASASPDALKFDGEIIGGGSGVFGRLVELSDKRNEVEVDCGGLRRMDFVSAGTLFNVLSTLQAKGRHVTLRNVNAMVLALLHVMGVGQVAKVLPRP